METTINKFLDFFNHSPSPFHTVKSGCELLKEAGFEELPFAGEWTLKKGGFYYTHLYGTTLFAFKIGSRLDDNHVFRLASAHTDSPCLRVKPNPEICEKDYLKLNVSVYGSILRSSWMDRPLSLAGRVALRSDDIFHPVIKLVNFDRPLLTIPNLAIHINREVNKGLEINPQKELLPILGMLTETLNKGNFFLELLAQELSVSSEDILDFDFYVYNWEKACLLGAREEFISSPRLDNLTSVLGCLTGLINSENDNTINMACLYDNEETGSNTKQGADSIATNVLLEKLYAALGYSSQQLYNTLLKSFLVSADVSHAIHPNYADKCDPTNQPKLGQGVVLKVNHNQRYATDTQGLAVIKQLCHRYHIPYQEFINRSDMPCGGTLGSISSAWLLAMTVDLGVPLLAMHSARELTGVEDQKTINQLLTAFFQTEL